MLAEKISYNNGDYISVEEYKRTMDNYEGKVEYIDGRIYMFAGGTTVHRTVINRLARFIGNNLKGNCEAMSEFEWYIENRNGINIPIIPDVVVVCDHTDYMDGLYKGSVKFVVEVTLPSTVEYDRTTKKSKYKELGVEEYVLVYPEQKYIEVYDLTADNIFGMVYNLYDDEEYEFVSKIRDDIRFKLKDIFKV